MQTLKISPNWQPIETAPKDGSIVRLLYINAGFREPTFTQGWIDVFWGVMSGYPSRGEMWVAVDAPDNGSYHDSDFIKETFQYNDYAEMRYSYLYRGIKATHWTRPWEVEVVKPFVEDPVYEDKIWPPRSAR